ncbi:hypothetical protein ACFX4N_24275 [Priestia sp. YIM B13551]|uniref:hypothetical protein n=1 Tax=Priestia sp. YIM B13551 TaxID=3366306 RepID=UPI0036722C1D
MKKFTFAGTSTIQRKFKIEVWSKSYDRAEEVAHELLDDVDDQEYYEIGNDQIDIEIEEVEEN